MAVETDPRIGTKIAGYRIEALIGRGGMSAVYRAEDLALDRKVALKLLSTELSEDESFRERFRVEWRRAASIEHPNVVPIYDAGETEGHLFIAMRYIEGTDLKALLETEGALEPQRALELVSQVAEGLDAAHNRGLVHRDVKPSNVLIGKEGNKELAYLADFGLTKPALTAEEAQESIQLSGTTDYVSPEQIADGTAEARSDIYSLGAVLYESLTGQVPFPRERNLQVLFAHVNEPPPKPTRVKPGLPAEIDEVIATAMAKEPVGRYGTGAELAAAAREALRIEEPRFSRRQLLLMAGAVGLAGAAVATGPAVVLSRRGNGSETRSILPLSGDSFVRIDAVTGEITHAIPAEGADWVGTTSGAVWFANSDARLLTRVDPQGGTAVETFDISRIANPVTFEAGGATIWITDDVEGAPNSPEGTRDVWAFVPASSSSDATLTRVGEGLRAWDLVADTRGLWIVEPRDDTPAQVIRIDEASGEAVAMTEPPAQASEYGISGLGLLAHGEDGVWLLSESLLRDIDPATGTAERWHQLDLEGLFHFLPDPFDRTRSPEASAAFRWQADFAAGIGGIWLLSKDDESVTRIDPETGKSGRPIRIGRGPTGIAAGEGAVWVTSARDNRVTRLDPETLDLRVIDVGGEPRSVAVGEGAVWVAVDRTPLAVRAAGEAPLKTNLAPGMYGGPTGFAFAERYQYPLDSEEGRAIHALRRLRQDGQAPDRLIVQGHSGFKEILQERYPEGAPSLVELFEEETGIELEFAPSGSLGAENEAQRRDASFDVTEFVSEQFGDYAEAGLLRPLDDFVERYEPSWHDPVYGYAGGESIVTQLTRYKGAAYAVGLAFNTSTYFYQGNLLISGAERSDFEDRYGRELRFPLTWDEQAEVSEFFTRPNADEPLYGDVSSLHPVEVIPNWLARFVSLGNPNLLYFNDDASANVGGDAGVRVFAELRKAFEWHALSVGSGPNAFELVGSCSGFGGGALSVWPKWLSGNDNFEAGNCAQWVRGEVMPGRIIDGALIRRPVAWGQIPNYGVNAFADRSRHEAAYLFLQWAGSARIHTLHTANPSPFTDPHHSYSLEDPYVARSYGPQPAAQLRNIIPRTAPAINIQGGTAYREALAEELQAVLTDEQTPEQAAKALGDRWNRITEEMGVETQVEALKTFFKAFPQITDTPGVELPVDTVI